MTTRRLFLSSVTNEFKSCRVRLSEDLRAPNLVVENQEEYIARIASGESTLIKLDDYIRECDAVIHLIGEQTSTDGRAATEDAVNDLLRRYPDFIEVTRLSETELRTLSYTQWEAWLAYYHKQTNRPGLKLVIAAPASDFIADHPPHAATGLAQAQSQACHAKKLRERGRYPEITFETCDRLAVEVLKALKDILPPSQPAQQIADSKLVTRHTADKLFGRDTELAVLDAAWSNQDTINIQCVIAWGGVGKTALLAHWVQTRFRNRGWKNSADQPDPIFYFDWTFYDQGTRPSGATHAGAANIGTFFTEALRHFGDPAPENPERKAERLAKLVQAHRNLIVLDGLEPLQYPYGHDQAGQITDPDLAQFLRLLAQKNPGLCVISSREKLSELGGHLASSAPQFDLDDLPTEAAIALLRNLGVVGSDSDLARAVEDYHHHALSLILLGRFLATARGGDIRQRDTVSFEKLDSRRDNQTRSAWHILETYENWLGSAEGNPTDLQALRLVGLFDRPATPDCLEALRQPPAIPSITDRLVSLDNDDWNALLWRLNESNLIQLRFPPRDPANQAPNPEPRNLPADAHPLVREYFARQLSENEPQSYQTAHARLFGRLCEDADYQPDTLHGLEPLYQAVLHGCLAGSHQRSCNDVYVARILRGTGTNGFFSTKHLGAVGADLGALTAFFDNNWNPVSSQISTPDVAWLLSEAAFRLRALGRITESQKPMQAGMERLIEIQDWGNAARSACNLSELELTLGELESAIAYAERAVAFADRAPTSDVFLKMLSLTTLADALNQRGRKQNQSSPANAKEDDADSAIKAKEVHQLFERAEALHLDRSAEFPFLLSIFGFRFCDMLLAASERASWRLTLTVPICYSNNACAKSISKSHPDLRALDPPILDRQGVPDFASFAVKSVRGSGLIPVLGFESDIAEAERRATLTLERFLHQYPLLDIALDLLTLARVELYRAHFSRQADPIFTAQTADRALGYFRKANMLDFLPRGLLTAAASHHLVGEFTTARALLDEAQQIAERGPMPLHLADVHLHRARLVGSMKATDRQEHWPDVNPKAELAKARALIEKHHYGRRFDELADAEAASIYWS